MLLPVRFSYSSQHFNGSVENYINDLLIATDERLVSLLVLLDFSKAFDSVNHVPSYRTSSVLQKVRSA
jgi:hypothetical protein